MRKKSLKIFLFFLFFLLNYCSSRQPEGVTRPIVNFRHLKNLTETITLNGQACDIVHIYSEYPDYQWVDAAGEGIACVDDVARAAVAYLKYFEITGNDSLLPKVKRLLNFVLYMQTPDGEFYNFIDGDHEINKSGKSSKKSFDFWAARGYWAIGLGYRIFKDRNYEFAARLKTAFLRCKLPIKKRLQFYRQHVEIRGRSYPLWLINRYGSDATATLLLGINEFLKAEYDAQLAKFASQLAEGVMEMQLEPGGFFGGAFLSWQGSWHAWGNAQTQALASLGKTTNQIRLIQAARREADHFYVNLLIHGLRNEWQWNSSGKGKLFPQIAYGVRCMSLGLLRLYQATGNDDYAKLAGLTASWFFGNNVAQTVMYDSNTGRGFDGIIDSSRINQNAGAESTIEALLTLIAITGNSLAKPYLMLRTVQAGVAKIDSAGAFRIFGDDSGVKLGIVKEPSGRYRLLQGDELKRFR